MILLFVLSGQALTYYVLYLFQPSGGLGQWILDESCLHATSDTGHLCDVTRRYHNALVYDFAISDWEIQMIEVSCCVAFSEIK